MTRKKIAMFDLDHTLLPLDSDYSWGRFTAGLGWVDRTEFDRQNEKFFLDYRAGKLDMDAYVAFATAAFLAQGQAAEQGMPSFGLPHGNRKTNKDPPLFGARSSTLAGLFRADQGSDVPAGSHHRLPAL